MAIRRRSSKTTIVNVLRAVTKLISSMSEEELDAFASGELSIRLNKEGLTVNSRTRAEYEDEYFNTYYKNILKSLENVESTKGGMSILEDAGLTRSELERIARLLDLPVSKQDGVSRLEEKLVETLVGSRLNSRAVRGR